MGGAWEIERLVRCETECGGGTRWGISISIRERREHNLIQKVLETETKGTQWSSTEFCFVPDVASLTLREHL